MVENSKTLAASIAMMLGAAAFSDIITQSAAAMGGVMIGITAIKIPASIPKLMFMFAKGVLAALFLSSVFAPLLALAIPAIETHEAAPIIAAIIGFGVNSPREAVAFISESLQQLSPFGKRVEQRDTMGDDK